MNGERVDARRLNVERALDYIAEDPRADRKIGVGMVLLLLPLANIAAVGYQVQVAREVALGRRAPLPAWQEPRRLFALGFPLAMARLVYSLPGTLIMLATAILALWPLIRAAAVDMTGGEARWQAALLQFLVIGAVGMLAALVYNLAFSLIAPAVLVQYVRRGTFAACFDLRAIADLIRQRSPAYLYTSLGRVSVGMVRNLVKRAAGLVLLSVPLIGPLLRLSLWTWMAFVTMLINAYFAGQLVRHAGGLPALAEHASEHNH